MASSSIEEIAENERNKFMNKPLYYNPDYDTLNNCTVYNIKNSKKVMDYFVIYKKTKNKKECM